MSVSIALLCTDVAWAQRTGPQLYKSKSFQMYTDLPQGEAEELLQRLETMMKLVSGYFGYPCRKSIRMFVVDDIDNWSSEDLGKMSPEGLQSVRRRGGLTQTLVRGIAGGPKLDADAIVFAVAEHGIPQHEAIHAYCGLTFGELGPVWYAEGMAEVGKYFRDGEKGVLASQYVIDYLKSDAPRSLDEIVNNPLEQTGDSWQNYSWRWVLCHLLGFNENYNSRFKPLGLSMMAGKNTTFDSAYGSQKDEIEFEYRLFLSDLTAGYRCDLCTWDWKTRFRGITGKAAVASRIEAKKGWQASRLLVKGDLNYTITTDGTWKIDENGEALTAAGDDTGAGQLVGIIFNDYELSEPFVIGDARTFTAPMEGKLYLRCQDNWGQLADNSGVISVKIQLLP